MRLPGARKSELADVDDRGVAAAAHHWHAGHALHHVHQAGNWAVGLDAGGATTAVVVGAGDVLGEGAAGRPPPPLTVPPQDVVVDAGTAGAGGGTGAGAGAGVGLDAPDAADLSRSTSAFREASVCFCASAEAPDAAARWRSPLDAEQPDARTTASTRKASSIFFMYALPSSRNHPVTWRWRDSILPFTNSLEPYVPSPPRNLPYGPILCTATNFVGTTQ